MRLSKYKEFLLEKEFNSIIQDLIMIVESEGKWINDRTIEWDLTNKNDDDKKDWIQRSVDKIKHFISKIPKEKLKSYFIRLMNSIKSLPDLIRKRLITGYLSVFLALAGFGYLITDTSDAENLDPKIKKEIVQLAPKDKSSFEEAQKLVKTAEAGYSDDKGDSGNWIDVPGGQRFVGTNHGISAPILAEYLGRLPKKEDMMNLSYETALKIYKKNYWDAQNLSEFSNQSVANIIYDGCVNQGIPGMRSILRDAYEENGIIVKDSDNIFGYTLISKANELDQEKLFNSIKKFREQRYKKSDTWSRHGKGWLNRLDDISYNTSKNYQELS